MRPWPKRKWPEAYSLQFLFIVRIARARLVREGQVRIARFVRGIGAVLKVLEDDVQVGQTGVRQHAHVVDQARDAPGREGAPGEAEQEDLVARNVVLRHEIVAGADVPGDALARRPADDFGHDSALGADAGFVEDQLRDLIRALGFDGATDARDVAGDGELAFVKAVVGVEPGSLWMISVA